MEEKYILFVGGQPSLRGHVAWSRECRLNRGFTVYPQRLALKALGKVSRLLIFLPFTQLPLCLDNQGSSVTNNI